MFIDSQGLARDCYKHRNSQTPICLSISQDLTSVIWPPQLQLHFQTPNFFFLALPPIPSLSNGLYFLAVTTGAQIHFWKKKVFKFELAARSALVFNFTVVFTYTHIPFFIYSWKCYIYFSFFCLILNTELTLPQRKKANDFLTTGKMPVSWLLVYMWREKSLSNIWK